jgi:predicted phage terminase large subunit-like protein
MYFNGTLPPSEPDMVFMAVDPAWGGGDFVAAPVVAKYGEELYIVDVIYDSSDKARTQPRVARAAEKWGVTRMYVEGTKTTSSYSDGISDILKRDNYRCSIKTSLKNALGGSVSGKNKQERIFAASSDIRQHMIFLEEGKRSKEYQMFMQNVYSFKVIGKNKHDDAPDSLQMAITFAFPQDTPKLTVRSRAGIGL